MDTLQSAATADALAPIGRRTDEVGQLARAIKHMLDTLSERERRLKTAELSVRLSEQKFRSLIENVTVCAGRSASVAVTVVTAVVFSATLAMALDVKTGLLSLTGVTVTDRFWSVVPPPETQTARRIGGSSIGGSRGESLIAGALPLTIRRSRSTRSTGSIPRSAS